jgi:hypothetical protein
MRGPRACGSGWTLPALMMAAILLSGCATPGGSETERTICRELRLSLPSWSSRDTPETLAAGARFIAVFEAVCL